MALVRVKVHLPNPEDDVLTYAEDYPGLVDMESAAGDLVPVYQRLYLRHGLVYVSPYVVDVVSMQEDASGYAQATREVYDRIDEVRRDVDRLEWREILGTHRVFWREDVLDDEEDWDC